MAKKQNLPPSVKGDIFTSVIMTIIIITLLVIVYELFGNAQIIDTNITSLFGAILAFSGLMTKQYLLRENIEYLHKWKKVESTINEITSKGSGGGPEENKISTKLRVLNNQAHSYMEYVMSEIKIIPVIPLLLIVLYGAALIGNESQSFSLTCLSLMLLLVSYLAQATISSNNLAIDTTDLDETIEELEEVLSMLKCNNKQPNQAVHRTADKDGFR